MLLLIPIYTWEILDHHQNWRLTALQWKCERVSRYNTFLLLYFTCIKQRGLEERRILKWALYKAEGEWGLSQPHCQKLNFSPKVGLHIEKAKGWASSSSGLGLGGGKQPPLWGFQMQPRDMGCMGGAFGHAC